MSRDSPPEGWPAGFVETAADRDALLALAHAGLTPRRMHALGWQERSAGRCLRAVARGAAGESARRAVADLDAGAARRALSACAARMIAVGEPGFLEPLGDLPDPPAWLFVRGRLPSGPAVSVVGARRCSPYGDEVATTMGRGLAGAGVCVVSGAARGVDGAAHRGALEAGGPTVAVLGSGIDVAYPAANRRLIDRIAERGAVVSEYPPGEPALPQRFPARNRLVAALGVAAIVVEGAEGSGSMITAEFALDLGRDVFAVPGPVTSPLSAVPHALLREGAELARGAADVLSSLGLDPGPSASTLPLVDLTDRERRVLDQLAGEPVTADALAAGAGLDPGAVLTALVALEIRGLVTGVGGRYRRTVAGGTA